MRLLSTDRAELHYFPSPEDVPDGYAILSHVWDKKEDTFQDLDALRVKCAMSGDNPRGFVSNKIRRSCTLAEKHGYKWIWIDTCCIDKSSSAELSEAINSMYRYYALSSVCYAFLRDVEAQRDMEHSVWYRRGWTLQELIAPKLLVFVSKEWKVLGTKGDLASKISYRTKIPEDVLQYEKDLAQVPVGQRMSWASGRETTRAEDRAYSLMGIFGINMPTLYGEGQNAFYRLQEEIMKVSTDSTLFAWGNYEVTTSSLNDYAIDKLVLCEDPQVARHHSPHPCKHSLLNERVLLASSPSEFSLGPMYLRNDDKILDELASTMDHSFEMTPRGVLVYLLVVQHRTSPHAFVALLSSAKFDGGRMIGLQLFRCFHAGSAQQKIPVFHVGEQRGGRLIVFKGLGNCTKPRWMKFYISGKPPFRSTLDTFPQLFTRLQLSSSSPFRISGGGDHALNDLIRSKNVTVDKVSTHISIGWAGSPPLAVQFRYQGSFHAVYFLFTLGCCQDPRARQSSFQWGPQWATVRFGRYFDANERAPSTPDWRFTDPPEDNHRCDRDHIDQWPTAEDGRWTRSYPMPWREVRDRLLIAFARCPLNPQGTTMVLKLEWKR